MRIAAFAMLGFATFVPRTDATGCLAGPPHAFELRLTTPNVDDGRMSANCPGWTVRGMPNDTYRFTPGWWASHCSVRAVRSDGAFTARSAPLAITPDLEPLSEHSLVLPEGRLGGAGLGIRSSCSGVRITDVVPGGPADRAGVLPGQWIVSVDGEAVGSDTWAVTDRTVGPAGSSVSLRLADVDGTPIDVQLVRAFVPVDWQRDRFNGL